MRQLEAAAAHAMTWKKNPIIYEINTWVWLRQLSRRYGRAIDLANVPPREIDRLASWRFDAVWLMGVWHRGRATRQSALNYLHEYRQALPDVTEADVAGSAYAIRDYQVERHLGGRDGLAVFRDQLRRRGLRLVLDFVPNHVATDHAWISQHSEYFIQGNRRELRTRPEDYFRAKISADKSAIIARGRDPYFPAWIDTAQLNLFHPGARRALAETLIDIGMQCDGVRCDMAMLALNAIFSDTWKEQAGAPPPTEFWRELIPAVRAVHPDLLLLAEVYWDLEHTLLKQGFDYTYDKRLYDRLVDGDIDAVKAHLKADMSYLRANIRFIENHDERRAMTTLGADRQRAAAALICTLPGATLLHQGQLSGRRVKLPVQISRAPDEPPHPLLERFYRRLLREVSLPLYRDGCWQMLASAPVDTAADAGANLIAYAWRRDDQFRLITVNLSQAWSRARLDLSPAQQLGGQHWLLYDLLAQTTTRHEGDSLVQGGLILELPPHSAQIFRFDPDPCPSQPIHAETD